MGGATVDVTMNTLDQLKQYTKVVADSGDFATLKEFAPQDVTTNPSLILAATKIERYHSLLAQAVDENRKSDLKGAALIERITDRLLILFGTEILKIVPGRVSTETDARLSFDTEAYFNPLPSSHLPAGHTRSVFTVLMRTKPGWWLSNK